VRPADAGSLLVQVFKPRQPCPILLPVPLARGWTAVWRWCGLEVGRWRKQLRGDFDRGGSERDGQSGLVPSGGEDSRREP